MAVEIETYLPKADESLTKPWFSRLLEFGMQCEPHPDFLFANSSGFLPIKLLNLKPTRPEFAGQEFLSGFEFYLEPFDFEAIPQKNSNGRRGLLNLLARKPAEPASRINPIVDLRLANCRWKTTFRFGSADVFELRLASISALILAELTGGVTYYPSDDQWILDSNAAQACLTDVEAFEASLEVDGYQSHPFEKWL